MSPERWQQIEEIFQNALDLSPAERTEYVIKTTDGDEELRSEVEKLLSQFEDASSFIETPALSDENVGVLSSLMQFDEEDPMLGSLLGNYRIEREIGRGGMGAVYEAIRADGEFRRKAAIKIVKRGMDTDFILRRFRNERQILATLEHPYITRLLDGGTTKDGRPYFVMDYIEGLPLYGYCDKHRLTIKERLHLFTRICEAVEYAHQHLVIHRDLKPSNILVSADGTPRLLDFGIAKLLNPDLASDTLQPTATAMRLMTIDYASPEQINGEKLNFPTDIYSLGVILFELLTGHRPYRFANRTPHEIARVICEEPPLLPSDAITQPEQTLPMIQDDGEAMTIRHLAELRQNSPDSLRELLRGNLDNITLTALSKLPEDRYQSVKALSTDIEKHVNDQPISARAYFPPIKAHSFQPAANTKLIAVLPLNLSNFSATGNTDENYLSLGLADAIISRLTNIRDFTVRPTSSILGYEKSEVDSFQAGKELGVDFLLEGRITKSGEKLRVSLQMLDVKKGVAIWAGQFDETSADVLALEDAISQKVAEALVTQVTGDQEVVLAKRGTDDPKAYEAYLKGRFYWNQFTTESLPKAIEQFQKAVELDPNYALAYVGLADFYNWANIYGLIPSLESVRLSENSVKKALELDEKLGEAYATYGLIEHNLFNWENGLRLHEKALELNPNYPHAHEWFAANLVGSGKTAKGLKEMARAEELDPLSLRTKTLTAWTTYQARDFSAALVKANEIITLDPNYPQGHMQKGYILTEIGDADEAVSEIEKGLSLMPDAALAKYYYCFALAAANRQTDARRVYDEMKNSDAYVKPMFLGLASVAVGEFDKAFEYLNIAADEFDPWLVWLGTEPKLEPIRTDRRYFDLLKRTKNPMLMQFARSEETQIEYSKDTTNEENTPENSEAIPSIFYRHRFKLATAAVCTLFVFIAYATGILTIDFQDRRFELEARKSANPRRSLAILPFKNETANPENDFLCDGLSDNLITRLQEISEIQVLSRSASFKFKNSEISPQKAGEEMQVEMVLVGKLIEKSDKVEVSVELIDVKSGKVVFRLEYGRPASQLVELQNQLATGISDKLRINPQTAAISKSYTENSEAFESYLKGEYHRQKATPEDTKMAVEFYKKSLEIDANYALAYQGLALAYRLSPAYGTLPPNEAYTLAKESALRALSIDPTLGSAYIPLASIKFAYDWDFKGAETEYKNAIQLVPSNPEAHSSYGNFLVAMGRFDEAIKELKIAQQFDPLSPSIASNIAWALYIAGRFNEAETQVKQVIGREPNFPRAYVSLGEIYLEQGKFDEAIAAFQKAGQRTEDPINLMAIGHVHAVSGRKAQALKVAQELESKVLKKEVSPFLPAVVYAGLNDKDKAFYWLERAYQERSNWLTLAKVGHRLKPLHGDPRFDDLLKRIGFEK